jgi:hypothetical protein
LSSTTSAGHASNGSRRARARSSGRGCRARTFAANAVRLQLHALACNLGNFLRMLATPNQSRTVADEPEGEADQDWCEGREPRSPCRLPDGRGRDPTANVPGDIAAHCGTAAAGTTSASVRRSMVMRSRATAGRSAPECQGKMARSDTRTPLGRPGMLEAIHTAHLRYIQFRRRL